MHIMQASGELFQYAARDPVLRTKFFPSLTKAKRCVSVCEAVGCLHKQLRIRFSFLRAIYRHHIWYDCFVIVTTCFPEVPTSSEALTKYVCGLRQGTPNCKGSAPCQLPLPFDYSRIVIGILLINKWCPARPRRDERFSGLTILQQMNLPGSCDSLSHPRVLSLPVYVESASLPNSFGALACLLQQIRTGAESSMAHCPLLDAAGGVSKQQSNQEPAELFQQL